MHIEHIHKVIICILDGWGESIDSSTNAVMRAHTPRYEKLLQTYPSCMLRASGEAVGLPEVQMGNSEVGHMNIGAGRVVNQILRIIDRNLLEGLPTFHKLPAYKECLDYLKFHHKTLHLTGIVSSGRVHGCHEHLIALARMAIAMDVPVRIHAITDGRDCPPQSSVLFLNQLQCKIPEAPLTTIIGRYYALDRDLRWERTEQAWRLIQCGEGMAVTDLAENIAQQYDRGINDEFLPAMLIDPTYTGIEHGDVLLCTNFRTDRIRQIVRALQAPDFKGFDRRKGKPFARVFSMVPYGLGDLSEPLFDREDLRDTLGEVLARAGRTQVRIAETEKFPHVTYFFNGGREIASENEVHHLIPSPKVSSYDLAPEMSAKAITDQAITSLETKPDLMVINYANPDMVGHTGDLAATIKAVETVDTELGRLYQQAHAKGYTLLLTADHGNAEQMWDAANNMPHTAHTTNQVRLIVAGDSLPSQQLADGVLGDIAPTALDLLGITPPAAMTGKILFQTS